MTRELGKLLIGLGIVLLGTGCLLYFSKSLSFLGKLPGDIRIERPGMKFYFPITTSLLLSLLLSALLYIFSRFK